MKLATTLFILTIYLLTSSACNSITLPQALASGVVALMDVDMGILRWASVVLIVVLVNWRISSLALKGK